MTATWTDRTERLLNLQSQAYEAPLPEEGFVPATARQLADAFRLLGTLEESSIQPPAVFLSQDGPVLEWSWQDDRGSHVLTLECDGTTFDALSVTLTTDAESSFTTCITEDLREAKGYVVRTTTPVVPAV